MDIQKQKIWVTALMEETSDNINTVYESFLKNDLEEWEIKYLAKRFSRLIPILNELLNIEISPMNLTIMEK